MQGLPACPQCAKANAVAEEWIRISHDGKTFASTVLTCGECNVRFKPDGELLTLSSPEDLRRDGTPEQQRVFTEIEKGTG
jgi:hypothetical protein